MEVIEEVLYIVNYNDTGRTEGGPTVTRHFNTREEAEKFIDRGMINEDFSQFKLTKQTSKIIKERIH